MSDQDTDITAVLAHLDGLLGGLRANVDALTAILASPPGPPSDPGSIPTEAM